MKLKAYSMPWVIYISILVSILLSSLLIVKSISLKLSNRMEMHCDLISDIDYGIEYALSRTDSFNDSIQLNGPSLIKISRNKWGYLDVIHVNGQYNNFKKVKTVLCAPTISKEAIPTLVVKHARTNISLSGNTTLEGQLYVPKAYLERAFINGKTFTKNNLYTGKLHNSREFIDFFNSSKFNSRYESIRDLTKIINSKDVMNYSDSISNSFNNETKIIHSKLKLDLSRITIHGNIIIVSDSLIHIKRSAKLNNVIIVAPIIVVESGFTGRIQLIVNDSLYIGKHVELKFPSIIAITHTNRKKSNSLIDVNTKIHGIVYDLNNGNSILTVSQGTFIKGFIYSNSVVDFKGELVGSLICKSIISKTKTSLFESVFIDAKISKRLVPDKIIASWGFSNSKNNQVLIEI